MASISSSDLWVEIWKRLPPKSICRFRCVCKLWDSLLTSSFFIALHHKFTASSTPASQKSYLLMPEISEFERDQLLQCVVYQPQEQQRGDGGVRERVTFLNLPYSTGPDDSDFECVCFRICGVVHGVVGLVSRRNIVLWNPTIRKHIYLWHDRTHNHSSVGIGFDAVKNELKVVVVPQRGPPYQVFSVEEDCWRTESLAGEWYSPSGHGCFVNGTIYWLMVDMPMLLLFDCEREEFKTMAPPPKVVNEYWQDWNLFYTLSKHGGKLSLLVHGELDEVATWPWCELWVMEEDNHGSSWRKVVWISYPYCCLSGYPYYILDPKNRIKLCSKSIPERLAMFDNQPLSSQLFEKTLFLMNAKNYPSPKHPLDCKQCFSYMHNYNGLRNTLFQSRLL